MTQTNRFTLTLIAALLVAWALSGERFLDAAFEMVDLGPVDDMVLELLAGIEEGKAALGLPDAFGATRTALHRGLGLD